MNKKKVMLIVPMLHQGGFERVCVETARILEKEYEVHILIFSKEDIAFDLSGLNVHSIDIGASDNKITKVCNVLKRVRKTKQYKKRLQIDYSYSFGPTASIVNVLSKGKDRVFTGLRGYTDLDQKRYISLITKKSDLVVCCSKMIQKEVENTTKATNLTTLYNPFHIERIEKLSMETVETIKKDSQNQLIVTMSREDDLKGFWHLIKAIAIMKRNGVKVELAIIGDGSFTEYKTLAKDLKIEEQVTFTGLKKNPYPYLKQGDLYVLTSIHEGFPNALVEAMALGKMVVASNCASGPAEILSDQIKDVEDTTKVYESEYGILMPVLSEQKNLDAQDLPTEDKKLAEILTKYLENIEDRPKWEKLAKKRAAMFDEETYFHQLKEIFEQK